MFSGQVVERAASGGELHGVFLWNVVAVLYEVSQYKNIKGKILKCSANNYFSKLCVQNNLTLQRD